MKNITFLFFLFLSSITFAQSTVRGTVYEQTTGEPAIFINVTLKGTKYGISTDINGFYSIPKVPAGDYEIVVDGIGYEFFSKKITLKDNVLQTENLYIEPKITEIKGVEITADRQKDDATTKTQISVTTINPKEIQQMPSVGGEADLAQYLQVLPGVTFSGDQGGQLYIRGGAPIQNKVLLDGMTVYNPFHSIGLFSVFDTDIIKNVEVYTGGFNAEYGGRISSIMKVSTKDGNKKKFAGKFSLSPFVGKAIVEGPLSKQKENSAAGSSFLISARTSYLKQTSKILYGYVDENGLPFNFSDLYGKLSFYGNNGSKVNLFGFNFTDRVNYRSVQDLNWNASGGGMSFVLIPNGSEMLIDGILALSNYKISLKEASYPTRYSKVGGFNLGLNFTYYMGQNEMKYGIEGAGFSTDFVNYNSINKELKQNENTTEFAAYFRYKYVTKKLILEPSFRLQYYATLGEMSPEPRMALKWMVTPTVRIKMAGGLYSQNLVSAVSDKDVVNLFYGFLSSPENLPSTFNGKDVTTRLQKATHLIGGAEVDINEFIRLNVEGYQNSFTQLTNINRNQLYEETPQNVDKPEELKKTFIIEKGTARGLDMTLKYTKERFYFWTVYSLMYVNRNDGKNTYVPHFDRRHNINLVASYTAGAKKEWEFNARFNLGSGFPLTQTQGFYENVDFSQGINTDYTNQNANLGVQYAGLNQGRLPAYHRLDLSAKRIFQFKNKTQFQAIFSVSNAYNRKNIFYFDRIKYQRLNQLPILPSIAVNWNF